MKKKVVLMILDGLGLGPHDQSNAVYEAKTPFLDVLLSTYPHTTLQASGLTVGLPEGQMGNSEVGHMNLGAGRTVYQDLGRINKAYLQGEFQTNMTLLNAFEHAKREQRKVHFIGLLSDGGVHSHIDHLKGLIDAAAASHVPDSQIFVHSFLDGRDTDPHGGLDYLRDLKDFLVDKPGQMASVIGRYFAMDRDRRWERIKQAYDLLVHGIGKPTNDLLKTVQDQYEGGITDEFMLPLVQVGPTGEPLGTISAGDVVIFYNFRTDRGRELTMALTQSAFPALQMSPLALEYVTMTAYDETFQRVKVLFDKDHLTNTLGEVLAKYGKTQTRIAETEKYPHVTFFFSGGREVPFDGEQRLMVASPKVATYDMQPEMSAQQVADTLVRHFGEVDPDFVCVNFANPDMVGHTGDFGAVVKAVETVDHCMQQVVESGLALGYSFLILADHGNAEHMINADGSHNTAHTTNLVPVILIDKDFKQINKGKLGDIAPTILHMMNIPIPAEMSGQILVK